MDKRNMEQKQINHAEAHVVNILNNLENIKSEAEKISGEFVATTNSGHKRIKAELRQVVTGFKVYIDVYFQLNPENSEDWSTVYRKYIKPNKLIVNAWNDAMNREFKEQSKMGDKSQKEIKDILNNLLF